MDLYFSFWQAFNLESSQEISLGSSFSSLLTISSIYFYYLLRLKIRIPEKKIRSKIKREEEKNDEKAERRKSQEVREDQPGQRTDSK